ncbi:MAG: hypothetical protein ACRENE_03190 [Polyangiaceae bacterium]
MTPRCPPRSSRRLASRVVSFVASAAVCVVLSGSGACVQTGASLGQHCLKDDDCFSGHCAAQICVSSAPELGADAAEGDSTLADAPGSVEGSTTDDGPSESSDASPDGAGPGDGSVTADADASTGDDATDAPSTSDAADGAAPVDAQTTTDGSNDASPEAAGDAPSDAPADAPSDAQLDVGAG